jgi:DNA helicase II / ATP-dependent DNA helicase PcrA
MANFTPSKYQVAVYTGITDSLNNLVIDAVAGSGKSTTIVEALKLIPSTLSVLFLAFNKAIVEELKVKIGQMNNVEVRTLHSLGMSAIMKTFKCTVDEKKYRTYVNDGMKYGLIRPSIELIEEEVLDYKSNIVKLVDLARVNLCDNVDTLLEIAFKHNLNILDNECSIALNAIAWGKNNVGVIDFTDMIYFPNVKGIKLPMYDFVFIDECQDLNAAQRELFLKCLKPISGRFVAVGDPRQAIYGFAGADIESFNILKNLPNTVCLPLSVSYRCASGIIDLAKTLVPHIEARENAPIGTVNREAKLEEIKDGDMILCRVTAPLVALCMQYIGNGVKAYIKGRDIGQNLINMIAKSKCRNIVDVLAKLEVELEKIAAKVAKHSHCSIAEAKEDSMYKTHKDKVRAIQVLAGNLKTSDAVMNRIEAIFKDTDRTGICLSTIHKAKGLETDNVFIICEDKMYNKYAMRTPWMAEQEKNLVYVAYTRAKVLLGFVTDFSFE